MKLRRTTGYFKILNRGSVVCPLKANGESIPVSPWESDMPLIDGDRVEVVHQANGLVKHIRLLAREREVVVVFDQGLARPLHNIGVDAIELEDADTLSPGELAVVLLGFDPKTKCTKAEVIEHLEPDSDRQLEAAVVASTFNIPIVWKAEALQQGSQAAAAIDFEKELTWRQDLRSTPFVTIDGKTAKDFDDAIHCQKTEQGWTLQVAIADVSCYVAAGSLLDRIAFQRGNSVYFPGYVIPMLPPVLSDQVCSLQPQQDRLALVCRIHLDKKGNIVDYEFVPAVICSHARLTYNQVQNFFNGSRLPTACKSKEVGSMLREAYRLYRLLVKQRQVRGALELDTVESLLLFNEEGFIRAIVPESRHESHGLIEEFMICANRCAARFLVKHGKDFLYRMHPGFKRDAFAKLNAFLTTEGLRLQASDVGSVQKLLEEVKEHPSVQSIQLMVLQSLSRAVYTPENKGHFGLALQHYTHFTSPIRRYPDLTIHRLIHAVLGSPGAAQNSSQSLKAQGQHCSMTEKRADAASYDFEKYLKCVYIQGRVGEMFEGRITAITSYGLFAQLDDFLIEGLLHVKWLGRDFYSMDESGCMLQGERTGHQFYLGECLKFVLMRVDVEKRQIDLALPGAIDQYRRNRVRHRRRVRP